MSSRCSGYDRIHSSAPPLTLHNYLPSSSLSVVLDLDKLKLKILPRLNPPSVPLKLLGLRRSPMWTYCLRIKRTGEGDQPGARDANQANRGAGSTLTLSRLFKILSILLVLNSVLVIDSPIYCTQLACISRRSMLKTWLCMLRDAISSLVRPHLVTNSSSTNAVVTSSARIRKPFDVISDSAG